MSMLTPLPATELALRDTLIHRAKGPAFETLCRMYHLPRPGAIDEEFWREALRAVLYGHRGTRGNLHAFLEAALEQFNTTYHCTVSPANPQRITWTSGGSDGGFTAVQVNRLFRVTYSRGSFVYKSVSPDFNAGPAVLGYLELCPFSTGYWSRPNFLDVEDVLVELLPFVWSDTGAVFYLWADMEDIVPPTYMQHTMRWQANAILAFPLVPVYPFGSDAKQMAEWTDVASALADPAPTGYTVTADTAGTWRNLIVNADNDGTPARGDSYVVTLQKKVVGVWTNTTLTCTLGAALKTASDAVNTVVLVEGDEVVLKVVPGAAVTAPLVFPKMGIYIDRPGGQPSGGELLENAWTDGDQAIGPWPLYLGESLDMELMNVLWSLLAAGVILDQKVAAFDVPNGLF